MDVSVAQDCSDFPPTGGSNPSQSRRTPSMEALVQPLEGCCTISLFSGALRTGIDGLFDFFDKLKRTASARFFD